VQVSGFFHSLKLQAVATHHPKHNYPNQRFIYFDKNVALSLNP